jgi:CRP-like cAMP-binding protein
MALGSRTTLPVGAVLFNLGDGADSLFVVDHGRLALTLPMKVRGKEQDVLIEERGAGETVGWSALVPPHRFTLKAIALVDSAVFGLSRTALADLFKARPGVGYVVARNVSAVVGQRLQVFQTMWLREMERVVEMSHA